MSRPTPDRPTPTTRSDDPAGNAELRLPVAEERVRVGIEQTERVAARVGMRTRVEEVPVEETLHREQVEIERVPCDRIVEEPPETRVEDGVTIIPVVEEVLVRRFRVIEEVRIARRVETVTHSETVALRQQEIVVEEAADAPGGGDPDTADRT